MYHRCVVGRTSHALPLCSYPPYFITVFPRHLRHERLLREFEGQLPSVAETVRAYSAANDPQADLSGAFDYNLSTGVSLETLRTNLRCLGAIIHHFKTKQRHISHLTATCQNAACVLLLWFASVGIDKCGVSRWLDQLDPQLSGWCEEACTKVDHERLVFQPFPSICSAQLVLPGNQKIFGSTEKDVQYTLQLLIALQHRHSPLCGRSIDSFLSRTPGARPPTRQTTSL
jgi:hypothetical protein